MKNIPIGLLRSAVAIVDTGSMIRASERVCLTASAISMQIKRLEEIAETPIFVRSAKSVQLTARGELLIDHARRILALNDGLLDMLSVVEQAPVRLGLIQDVADTALTGVLADIVTTSPNASLQVKVAGSVELRRMLADDMLDMIVCIESTSDSDVVCSLPMQWFGEDSLLAQRSLPLALLDKPCLFRKAALDALAAAERDHHIVLETPSVAAIRGAVEAGLAITCRTALTGQTLRVLPSLPKLAEVSLAIKTGSRHSPLLETLRIAMARSLRTG